MKKANEGRITALKDYILAYQREYGRAPTYRTIRSQLGYSTISTVAADVARLKERGELADGSGGWDAIGVPDNLVPGGFHNAPIVGTVRCGQPDLAVEDIVATVALPDEIFGQAEHMILRASGRSMIRRGIFGGDLMVVRRQPTAQPGQTVVALLEDGTATCKVLAEDEHGMYLRAANDETDAEGNRLYDVRPGVSWSIIGVVDFVIHAPNRDESGVAE